MIVVEAMLHGIPVIASNAGGIAEAKVGVDYVVPVNAIDNLTEEFDERMLPIPIVPSQPLEPWIKTLKRLLADETHYISLARKSRKAALEANQAEDIRLFEKYLFASQPRSPEQGRYVIA